MTTITTPTLYVSSSDLTNRKGGLYKIGDFGAIERINREKITLGDMAYEDLVEFAKLGTTMIDGGYIKTSLIDVDTILGVTATFSGALSAATGSFTGTVDVGSTVASGVTIADLSNVDNYSAATILGLNHTGTVQGHTVISGGKINTGLVVANSILADNVTSAAMHTNALSTCKFYCSDGNDVGFLTFRNYTTTSNSTVAIGGVYTGSIFGEGGYFSSEGNSSSNGVRGVCFLGKGASGYSISGTGAYGQSTSGKGLFGVSDSDWGVAGQTTTGTWGLGTNQWCYALLGFAPFTGSHLGFSNQLLTIGDIVCVNEAFVIAVSEAYVSVEASKMVYDKAVIGVISLQETATNILESPSLKHLKDDDRFFDKIVKNEKTLIIKEDNPDRGEKRGDVLITNDGYDYIIKTEDSPDVNLANIMQDPAYHVVGINALGEGGINVCSEGGNIEIGDYICSSSIPGKGMKQDDNILHSYTVAKSLEKMTWGENKNLIKMIACTYHCG